MIRVVKMNLARVWRRGKKGKEEVGFQCCGREGPEEAQLRGLCPLQKTWAGS